MSRTALLNPRRRPHAAPHASSLPMSTSSNSLSIASLWMCSKATCVGHTGSRERAPLTARASPRMWRTVPSAPPKSLMEVGPAGCSSRKEAKSYTRPYSPTQHGSPSPHPPCAYSSPRPHLTSANLGSSLAATAAPP